MCTVVAWQRTIGLDSGSAVTFVPDDASLVGVDFVVTDSVTVGNAIVYTVASVVAAPVDIQYFVAAAAVEFVPTAAAVMLYYELLSYSVAYSVIPSTTVVAVTTDSFVAVAVESVGRPILLLLSKCY